MTRIPRRQRGMLAEFPRHSILGSAAAPPISESVLFRATSAVEKSLGSNWASGENREGVKDSSGTGFSMRAARVVTDAVELANSCPCRWSPARKRWPSEALHHLPARCRLLSLRGTEPLIRESRCRCTWARTMICSRRWKMAHSIWRWPTTSSFPPVSSNVRSIGRNLRWTSSRTIHRPQGVDQPAGFASRAAGERRIQPPAPQIPASCFRTSGFILELPTRCRKWCWSTPWLGAAWAMGCWCRDPATRHTHRGWIAGGVQEAADTEQPECCTCDLAPRGPSLGSGHRPCWNIASRPWKVLGAPVDAGR